MDTNHVHRLDRASSLAGNDGKICILDYLNFREYLRDQLAALARRNAKFSQRWVAKRIQLKSPQMLSMIVSGQRSLSAELTVRLAELFGLDDLETEYFQCIAELGQTVDRDIQERLLAKIKTSFQTGLFKQIPESGKELFRHWYLPAILELVATANFEPDPRWLSSRLGITFEEAKDAWDLLQKLGFVALKDGKFVKSEPSLHTGDKLYPMVLGRYHLQMLERAFKATTYPRKQRYFECITFSAGPELLPKLVDHIKRFFREMDAVIESQPVRKEVYQLNVQLFPLTKSDDKPGARRT